MNFYDKYDFCEVMFKFLCGHVFSFLMIIYLCVETLSHIITLCLTIWGTAEILSKVATHSAFPTSVYEEFSFFTSLLTFGIVNLFEFSSSSGCVVVVLVILICISLMNNGIEYFFMCLFIHIFFKCLYKSFAHLKMDCFVY